jgi:DNA-binding transcriptional LysR family regulator
MLNWNDLQYVICVARTGSYFKASSELNTNPSTVTRRVRRLEASLGVKIFDRHAHGMQLTPAGQLLLDQATAMESIAQSLDAQLSGLDAAPMGTVKISTSEGIGYIWLAPRIARFCAQHPRIDVEIQTNSEGLNFLARDIDIAISPFRPAEPRLVVMRIASLESAFFASEKYLEKYGRPASLAQLQHHQFVDYSPYHNIPGTRSIIEAATEHGRIRLHTNSASVYLVAIREGLGIGALPLSYKSWAPDLIELGIATGLTSDIWLVSHEETNKAHRVRLLLDFLKAEASTDGMLR